LSGKGQSKLKLSGNGNECKPLFRGFFLIDLVSIMPYDDISTATGGGANLKILRVVGWCRWTLSNPH
jgi:hypothetical protein